MLKELCSILLTIPDHQTSQGEVQSVKFLKWLTIPKNILHFVVDHLMTITNPVNIPSLIFSFGRMKPGIDISSELYSPIKK